MWFLNLLKWAKEANSSRKWIMAILVLSGVVFREEAHLDEPVALIVFASVGALWIIVQGIVDIFGVVKGVKHPDPAGKSPPAPPSP